MTQQILESSLNKRIRLDDELKLAIAKANGVRVDTVNRWLREDDEILTTAKNLQIIKEAYKLSDDSAMIETKELEPAKS